MGDDTLEERILAFARDESAADFGDLALAVFERQFESLPDYRRHCEELGITPAKIAHWHQIPAAAEPTPIDTGSRPKRAEDSVLDSEFIRELYRGALPDLFDSNRLRLIVASGAGSEAPTTFLDTVGREAPEGSWVASQRLEAKKLRSWLGARQRDRKPVCVVSDADGFARLLDTLERRAVKFRLPPGSEACCAVSFEAAGSDVAPTWSDPLLPSLGLPPEACRRVLTASGASTPLLEQTAARGRFRLPHWVRVAPIASGQLAIFDLAALDTPPRRIAAASGFRFV